jgi:hypothetical protein
MEEPDYKRLQFTIADLLGVMVMVAVLGAASRLPGSPFRLIPLLAVLYVVKYRILALRVRPRLGLLLYFLVAAALLPYYNYCDAIEFVRVAQGNLLLFWVNEFIEIFTVPTVFHLYDTLTHKSPSRKFYAIRSSVEIVVLVPLWELVWISILRLF